MNINLFKKNIVPKEKYITQDEFKIVINQIYKRFDKQMDKQNEYNDYKKKLNDMITYNDLNEKSEMIIGNIQQHIEEINQYNHAINGYLLQQLKDKIDAQSKVIHDLYEELEKIKHGTLL